MCLVYDETLNLSICLLIRLDLYMGSCCQESHVFKIYCINHWRRETSWISGSFFEKDRCCVPDIYSLFLFSEWGTAFCSNVFSLICWVMVSVSFWNFINVKQCLHKCRIIFISFSFLLIFAHERVLPVLCTYELNTSDYEHFSWPVFAYTLCPRMNIYLISNLYCAFISQPLDIHANIICLWGFYCCPALLTFFSLFTSCMSCLLRLIVPKGATSDFVQ